MSVVDAEVIEAFVDQFLRYRYDEATEIPEIHRDWWRWYCDPHKYGALAAPRGHAKAQPLDACVLTPTGWAQIGDLRVGDEVIGRNGVTHITHLHPISEMSLYEITTRDGRKTRCNGEHLWTVRIPSNQKTEQTLSVNELLKLYRRTRFDKRDGKERTEYRCMLPLPKVEFPEAVLPIAPYTLGVWLGDGSSANGRITSADPEIFDYFDCPVKKSKSGKYLYAAEGLSRRLRLLGVKGNKHIPREYLYSSYQQRLCLLRGLMDTDGTVHCEGKIAYFSNTNWSLASGVVHLVRSLGGTAFLAERKTKCNGKYFDYFHVSIKMPEGANPFGMRRKASKWLDDWVEYTYIVGIERVTPRLSRCITVEAEDGLYITDGFMLTHNSTTITHAASLCEALQGAASYFIIVSDTEEQAKEFLGDIKSELNDNEELIQYFGVQPLRKDTETDIICKCDAGVFRFIAKGAEQKIRGRKWNGKRPDRIICDDMENDESVESKERRTKFMRWFQSALLQAGSTTSKVRVIGTILHMDSLLERLLNNPLWMSMRYEAHNDDFGDILWPERWPLEKLMEKRRQFASEGMLDGYNREYRNKPISEETALFKREWLVPVEEKDRIYFGKTHLRRFIISTDLAVSTEAYADYSVFGIVGVDDQNCLFLLDVIRERMDSAATVEKLFELQKQYRPDAFLMEKGVIEKSIMPLLKVEMVRRGTYMTLLMNASSKDKVQRAKAVQKIVKAGGIRFDKTMDNWADLEEEITRFPKAKHDDMVDMLSLVGLMIDKVIASDSEQEMQDEEYAHMVQSDGAGRNPVCGY